MLALSVVLWAEGAVGMLSAAGQAAQCHARMPHMQHQASSMPCCPSHVASVPATFFAPPPCCDLSNQPARPLAFAVISGKSHAGEFSASSVAVAAFAPRSQTSALRSTAESPPFVKLVFDLKTDLRI